MLKIKNWFKKDDQEIVLGSQHRTSVAILSFCLMFALIGGYFIYSSFAASPTPAFKTNSFSSEPGWEAVNNQVNSTDCKQVSFNFGYSGTSGSYARQIGGDFTHSAAYRAYYAKPITAKDLDDSFSASGTLTVPKRNGVDLSFGWFNHKDSTDWRASNSILAHIAQPPDTDLSKVDITAAGFDPGSTLMKVGDNLQWTNTDTADHQVIIDSYKGQPVTSPVLKRNEKFKFKFEATGTYAYHDATRAGVTGTIEVKPAGFFKDTYSAFGLVVSKNYVTKGTKEDTLTNVDYYSFGQSYKWTLKYDPSGGPEHTGTITLTVVDGQGNKHVSSGDLWPAVRADGAILDRFGFLATQAPASGGSTAAYIDNLVIDGAPMLTFDSDPGSSWEGLNNRPGIPPASLPAEDCYVTNRQNFKYVTSNQAGGAAPGEIGGGLWPQPPAYYADSTSTLHLTDTFYVTGKIALRHDTLDSDFWLGWFNAGTKDRSIRRVCKTPPDGRGDVCREIGAYNMLTSHIGGPTRTGFRFTPSIRNNTPKAVKKDAPPAQLQYFMGDERHADIDFDAPLLNPHGAGRDFWICYVPDIDGQGNGQITSGLSADPALGIPAATSIKIIPSNFKDDATFNRFGVISASNGGKVVEIFLDDLRYTVGPGDSGPNEHCRKDTFAPKVSMSKPKKGDNISGTTELKADASDTGSSGVANVEFKYGDSTLIGSDNTAPYSISWDTTKVSNKSYTLTAIATDGAGNKTVSSAIDVAVTNNSSPPPPNPHEGKIIYGSDLRQYLVIGGTRHYIQNIPISACLQVRRGTGTPIQVADSVVDGIGAADAAYCYYEQEPGLNFVRESGTPTVWLVSKPNGTKRHVGGLCANPNNLKKFKVFEVPAGETEGHSLGYHWFPTDHANACSELPG